MKTSRFVIIIGGVVALLSAAPCFAVDTPSSSKDASVSNNSLSDQDHALAQAQEVGEYRIGPEDVLDISVWNNSAISRTVPVRPTARYRCRWSTMSKQPDSPPTSCGACF